MRHADWRGTHEWARRNDRGAWPYEMAGRLA